MKTRSKLHTGACYTEDESKIHKQNQREQLWDNHNNDNGWHLLRTRDLSDTVLTVLHMGLT